MSTKLFEEMSIKINKLNKAHGLYSVYDFIVDKSLTLQANKLDVSSEIFHHRPKGDFVSKGIIENNVYTGKREYIWSNTVTPVGVAIPSYMVDMPEKLVSGQCFTSRKNISSTSLRKLFVFENALIVPDGHVALKVTNADGDRCYIVQPV